MKREEVLAYECPQCKAWKGQPCKAQNRAMTDAPVTATTKPTSRLHLSRRKLAIRYERKLDLV